MGPLHASCDPAEVAHIEKSAARDPNNIGVGVVNTNTGIVRIFAYDDTEAFSMANPALQVMAGHEAAAAMADVQAALGRVALSLDAFVVNGIPNGVINRAVFNGFLEKAAGNLLDRLTELEGYAQFAPVASRLKVAGDLAALRAKAQQLIERVCDLIPFRSLPLHQVRSAVSQIGPLRAECVQLIEELEEHFGTPGRFYQSRPAHAAASVNAFLADLETVFVQEWNAARIAPARSLPAAGTRRTPEQ